MRFLLSTAFVLLSLVSISQDVPSIKFGKISESNLNNKSYSIDTGAAAVVLADIGHTQVKGNSNSGVSLEFRHYRRIHILKNSGYDFATIEIPLYKDGDAEEKISDLKAVTYNMVNGKIVETKVNVKSELMRDRITKNFVIQKFAFPNVKEGSIIEYEYKITSDFLFNPQSWSFQSEIPHLWSQYTISIPQFLDYMVIAQGDLPYYINDRKDREGNYMVEITKEVYGGTMATDRVDISCAVGDFRWAMKDVSALKKEPYTSTLENYVAKLEFQLAGFLQPFLEKKVMTTWPDMAKDLMKSESFGGQLANTELWLASILTPVLEKATSQSDKAHKIFEYVQKNFTCTDYSQLRVYEPLSKIASKKRGGVAEINLLLTALFRGAGLTADPVILSTRSNGFVNDEYPVFRPFNYVISRVKIDGKDWLVDASQPRLGFGKLHYECYNGTARVLDAAATPIVLSADQLTEKRQSTVFIYKEPAGKWTGYITRLYGYYASESIREKIAKEGNAWLLKDLTAQYSNELKVDSLHVDSLSMLDAPISMNYLVKSQNEGGDVLYISPILGERLTQNPFKSTERLYPVEIPYKINELYTLNMEIPDGYVVDEMPKPVKFSFNTTTVFDYTISQSAGRITVNYKLDLGKTVFFPTEYPGLREFFAKVVSKLDEQIVLKKKP